MTHRNQHPLRARFALSAPLGHGQQPGNACAAAVTRHGAGSH